jgi:hypothetical protein
MVRYTKKEIQESKEELLKILKPGDTVYTVLKHVSRSGMYRVIQLKVIKDNRPMDISYLAAPLLEGYDEKHGGCKTGGCGMDMGFHLVYNLGARLFGHGAECEKLGYLTYRNGEKKPESDGGYLLRQEWL